MAHEKVWIIPLGGMEAIGRKNCYAILYLLRGVVHVLFCDYGQELPPLELVVGPDNILPDKYYPDVRSFLKRDYQIDGVLVSHPHRDHAAGLPHLERELKRAYPERDMPPVFVSRFGERVIKNILYGKRVVEDTENREENYRNRMEPIPPAFPMENPKWDEPYEVGAFRVWAFPVIHSTPGSLGFFIEAGEKRILYLGDFKLLGDYKKQRDFENRMNEISKRGVDVLLLDSTNAHEDGYAFPERTALKNIEKVMLERPYGNVAIASFSSHGDRHLGIIDMARQQRRPVYAFGTSVNQYLQCNSAAWGAGWDRYRWEKNEAGERIYPRIPGNAIVLVTGIEAELNSGIFKLLQDVPWWNEGRNAALMFSGSTIPHEDIIQRTDYAVTLASQRCDRVYLARDEIIFPRASEFPNIELGYYHFSGHAKRGDLERLIGLLNGQVSIAIPGHAHKERREEVQGLLADSPQINVQLVEEGEEFNV